MDVYSDGEDEGQTYEGSHVAGPDGQFEARVKASGPNVTATVTDANGGTSPFSQPFAVPPYFGSSLLRGRKELSPGVG